MPTPVVETSAPRFNFITESLLDTLTSEEEFEVLMEEFSDGDGNVPFLHEFVLEECDISVIFNSDTYSVEQELGPGGEVRKTAVELDGTSRMLEQLPAKVGARVRYEKAQMADKPNRNRRIYEFVSMIAAVSEVHNRAKRGEVFILKGHPSPYTIPSMEDASGLLRLAELDEQTGQVAIEIDIFKGTRALDVLESKGALPISSRAMGKMSFEGRFEGRFGTFGRKPKKDADGNEIRLSPWLDRKSGFFIMREFKFLGWDLVPGIQSVPGAIARPGRKEKVRFNEEVEQTENTKGALVPENPGEQEMTLKELKEKYPELVQQIEQAHGTKLTATHVEALKAKDVEMQNVVSSHETEFTAQGESLQELEGSIGEKDAQIEELEKAISELSEDGEPEELDPRVIKAMERSEALEKELAEVKKRQVKAEEEAHAARMEMFVEAQLDASPYSRFADLLKPMIVAEGHVPPTEADAQETVDIATGLVCKILERYRAGKSAVKIAAKGKPAHTERTETQIANERQRVASVMGDGEDLGTFG